MVETIYLIVFSLGIIGGSFYYFPFFICIFLISVITFIVFFYKRKAAIFLSIILAIFMYRLENTIYKERLVKGDIIEIKGRVESGQGKIKNLNGKTPLEKIYFLVDKVNDGEMYIKGEVNKIVIKPWGKYYKITPISVKENYNIIKKYFSRNINLITENYSISLRNLYKGVILGEKEKIDYDLIMRFRKIGISHLLVISGLHISIIIGAVLFLLKSMKIKKEIRYILTLGVLSIYVFSIGINPSVFRAYIMGSIYILGNIIYEKVHSGKSLCVAFIISLLIYPYWMYELSFIMSYIAVFSIVYVYPKIPKINLKEYKRTQKIVDSLVLILTIQICMIPVSVVYFENIQILSFISNFLLIPLGSIFILTAFFTLFLSFVFLGSLGAPLVNLSYEVFMKSMELVEYIPYLTLEL